ncbi:acyl-CoA thioester hydrolase/BAAT C-terminal domain-containing protein [Halobacterium jilantaiense]|uniref:Acyl-CoA thioester hydrolase/BAAT N-terminal region n=1 Tax=Halobacterium jilantaiense TaxID=355548 RepID=A0A1I0Q7B2_9EURY|nr:acyl-CoA thioester hydrolase/BAAT C-terminal domain-containing protein [Halobacterium jilantaiense]SEW22869.1 Acyl-CoA thioester hydrolase/BAAT N-terminal region [Halobacterium jilantaiense]
MTATPPADGSGSAPILTVTPDPACVTDRLAVTVCGLHPDQRVTLEAAFADLGTEWASEATFTADGDGRVDLTEHAPVAGDYDGVRPMGLVQFAELAADDSVHNDTATETTDLHLTARVDGDEVASTTVTRRVAPGVEHTELDPATDGLAGDLHVPEDDGPYPGVLALHGSGGEPLGRKARVLAAEGCVVLALRYFGGSEPVCERFAEVPVADAGRAVDFLRDHPAVTAGDVGVVGVSRGSELALLAASERDDIGVVVGYAPSAYTWFGDGDDESAPPSAWTVDGEPLSTLPLPDSDSRGEETERGRRGRPMFEAFVADATDEERRAARLPVEAVAADVVLVSGGDDGVWPADQMAETLAVAMRDAAGRVTHHEYADAGHSIFLPYHPTTERTVVERDDGPNMVHGGTPTGSAAADRDSWQHTLDALDALR